MTTTATHGALPWPTVHDLTDEQKALRSLIANGKRAQHGQPFQLTSSTGQLEGPFNAMLLTTTVGTQLQYLGEAIRYGMQTPDRAREIAILELARLRQCDFEWYAHERLGRQSGLTEEELQALMTGSEIDTLDPQEEAIRHLTRELAERRDVDGEHLSGLRDLLGDAMVMEVITLVGYYDLLALSLNVWRTPLPEGDPLSLLDGAPETLKQHR